MVRRRNTALGALVILGLSGAMTATAGAVGCVAIVGDFPLGHVLSEDASMLTVPGYDSSPPIADAIDAPACGGEKQSCCDGGACAQSLMCVAGTCQSCPSGQALCNGTCVDTQASNTDCGGCGLSCNTGCNAGECLVTLASNIPSATCIAVNAIKAYVTSSQASGGIYAMSLSGGGAINLTVSYPQDNPYAIALDAQNVYWTNDVGGTVMKMPLGGGVAPTTIANGQATPMAIAVDATNVYWTNHANPGGVVMKAPLGGGAVSTLVGGLTWPYGIVVDSTYAYVAVSSDNVVLKVELSTGIIASRLTTLENGPFGIAIDANNVFFTNFGLNGDVRQVKKTDTNVGGTILGTATRPKGVATDGVNVYWAAGNAIYKAQVGVANSGKAIAMNQNGASFVAVDGTSVYWTNSDDGTVMKLTPK